MNKIDLENFNSHNTVNIYRQLLCYGIDRSTIFQSAMSRHTQSVEGTEYPDIIFNPVCRVCMLLVWLT